MALQIPKIDFTDAKTRVMLLFGGVLVFILAIYFGMKFFSNPDAASGASSVAGAPNNLQSVPGGQLTPEYYKAVVQANSQAAKQAQMSGGSAVPTLLNEAGGQPEFQATSTPACTVVCPTDENANVQNDVNDLVKAGKLTAENGKKLTELANKNVSVSEYAAQIDQLVKQGKLAPENARKLLDDYKKQHKNVLLQESGKAMDDLIKSGQLSSDDANHLLELQKKQPSAAEYAAEVNQMAKEGKISAQTAQQLIAQYSDQHAKEATKEAAGQLQQMVARGEIAADVANELAGYQQRKVPVKEYEEELQHLVKQGRITPEQAQHLLAQYSQQIPAEVTNQLADYQRRNVSPEEYGAVLQRMVSEGKLTPEQAKQMLEQYRQTNTTTATGTMERLIKESEKENEDAIRNLAAGGKISPETAQELTALQKSKVSVDEYKRHLDEMVKQGKISEEDAQKLLNKYAQTKNTEGVQDLLKSGKISQETADKLINMQKANLSTDEYKRNLDQMVKDGKISKEDAQKLLNNYAQMNSAAQTKNTGDVQDLLKSGKISQETADKLMNMQKANLSADEYKRNLDQMVKDGKISQEDAQKLLSNYAQMNKTEGVQDLLKSGKISQETADKLINMQKANSSVDEYKRSLDQMVKDGKISQADAQKLLNNYAQTKNAEGVQDLLRSGKISQETADKLMNMQKANSSVDEYKRNLDQMVKDGKISQEDAQKLLKNYQSVQGETTTVQQLAAVPKITPETAQKLLALQQANVPVEDYKRQVEQLVKEGKISPEEADKLNQKYEKLHAVREQAERLTTMRAKSVPEEEYAAELKRAVAAGTVSADDASRLLQEYHDSKIKTVVAATTPLAPLPEVKGADEFAALQKRVQAAAPTVTAVPEKPPVVSKEDFSAAGKRARAEALKLEQDRLQALMGAMSQQAGQLISSWQPPVMAGAMGAADKPDDKKDAAKAAGGAATGAAAADGATVAAPTGPPLVKAGDIMYAVLDTAVNSDFPDSPVMATIVDGKLKGSKLLGKLALTTGQDRVTLTFKLMNRDDWNTGKTINAFAIDPDTARTVFASDVNNHYFMKYGSMVAASFVQGYASAIGSSGGTTSSGIFGTTTTSPALSPAAKFMTGVGKVGQTFGTTIATYATTPATVKIDPGVSLGILFMADVTG